MSSSSSVDHQEKPKPSAAAQAAREITCGTIAGFFGKFVDYPFDCVKTRLQAPNSPYKNTMDVIKRTAMEEGFWGFYGGIMSPCAGSAFENAAAFLMYGRASSFLMQRWGPKEEEGKAAAGAVNKPLWIVSAAGAFSGIGTATVLTPVEFLKGRVQVNPKKYPSIPATIKTVFAEEGPFAVFNGFTATLAREIPGNAMWFLAYEVALRNLFIPTGKTRDDVQWYAYPAAGAIGGIFYWGTFFPADTAKTRMQTDPRYSSMNLVQALKTVYREGGVGALYLGIGITLVRACPANAFIFGAYEYANKALPQFG